MGILDFFRSQLKTTNQQCELKDERKAECPNCQKAISKIPGAKTKCPHCGDFMYVRTGTDNVRVVITKNEADIIDEAWRIENGIQEAYLAEQKRFNNRKELLRKKIGGKEPSENDVRWGLLNENLLACIRKKQWGLYMSIKREMVEILEKENKIKAAFQTYLSICYLEQNGATNAILDENQNPIEDKSAIFFPGDFELNSSVRNIKDFIGRLNTSRQEVRDMYTAVANKMQKITNAPRNPMDCLKELGTVIWIP